MGNNIVLNEPLSRHTSWKVGGPADIFFTPNDRNDLSYFLKSNDCIITWLGNGTNILVRDAGVRGAVISTRKSFNEIELIDELASKLQEDNLHFMGLVQEKLTHPPLVLK